MIPPRQLPLGLPQRPALGMEDFLVADCNRAAVAWIDRWPEWPGPLVVLYGPEGCGKTHLAHVWQARTGAGIVPASELARIDPGEFGGRFALDLERAVRERGGSYEDALATATELTARTVAHAIREETPRRVGWRDVLVGGGGAANPALMDALRGALAPIPVRPTDELGVPAEAREALAFAILAAYRLRGLPNTLPRRTGASRAVSAGAIHAP